MASRASKRRIQSSNLQSEVQHPQTLLQRISLSLSSLRLAMTPRRSSSRKKLDGRSRSAPHLENTGSLYNSVRPSRPGSSVRACSTGLEIPILSQPDSEPCHAFSTLDSPRCHICGRRGHLSDFTPTTLSWSSRWRSGRPESPRLHHVHGLSRSDSYPYVHKHEVSQHLDALRAGSASPLRQRPDAQRRVFSRADYSETVFYGASTSSMSGRGAFDRACRTVVVFDTYGDGGLNDGRCAESSPVEEVENEASVGYQERSSLAENTVSQVANSVGSVDGGRAEQHAVAGNPGPETETGMLEASSWCSLRGGAGSPPFFGEQKLSPTLYWLAGGTGVPISVSGWRKHRPKKRMDGLLGMVMHGRRAGMAYGEGGNGGNVSPAVADGSEPCSVGTSVDKDSAASIKSVAESTAPEVQNPVEENSAAAEE